MSAERISVPEPICEKCWLKEHTHWEPESVDDTGSILFRLKGVDVPLKYNTGQVETCTACGEITISGIFDQKSTETKVFKRSPGKHGFGLAEEDSPEDYK